MSDANFWAPRNCLVSCFAELDLAVDLLSEAADAVLSGDSCRVRDRLHRANLPIVRERAIRAMGALDPHIHRLRRISMPPKSEKSAMRMPGKAVADSIFARDGWRCRFCGVRVVVPAARRALQVAAPEALCWHGRTAELHAAFIYISATLDHVVPHAYGGTNAPENLVAACWPCNFGRGGYLLEQMGLADPRERPPLLDGWDGLTRLLWQTPKSQGQHLPDRVSAPSRSSPRPAISPEAWLEQVTDVADDVPDRMLALMASCERLPVSWSARDVLLLKMSVGNRTLEVIGFERSGAAHIPWFIGDAKPAFRNFAEAIADAVPGAVAYETPKTWKVHHAEKRPLHVEELLQATKAISDALAHLQADLSAMGDA